MTKWKLNGSVVVGGGEMGYPCKTTPSPLTPLTHFALKSIKQKAKQQQNYKDLSWASKNENCIIVWILL